MAIGIRAVGFECRDTIAHQQAGLTWEPILVFRKPIEESTVARQVLKTGTGAINVDSCRISVVTGERDRRKRGTFPFSDDAWGRGTLDYTESHAGGRWPANLTLQHADCDDRGCIEGCPVKVLDGQSGERRSSQGGGTQSGSQGGGGIGFNGQVASGYRTTPYFDAGGASRYFSQFKSYQETLDWLVTLVTPKDGTTLILH